MFKTLVIYLLVIICLLIIVDWSFQLKVGRLTKKKRRGRIYYIMITFLKKNWLFILLYIFFICIGTLFIFDRPGVIPIPGGSFEYSLYTPFPNIYKFSGGGIELRDDEVISHGPFIQSISLLSIALNIALFLGYIFIINKFHDNKKWRVISAIAFLSFIIMILILFAWSRFTYTEIISESKFFFSPFEIVVRKY